MKHIALITLSLLLGACYFDNNDNDPVLACSSSSDYQEFECVKRNDFLSENGKATAQSQAIAACTILSSKDLPCNLNTLSFIAVESPTPSKAQIMSHVIVSHQWMADNFSKMLDNMPPDMYNLFASVTAIVIHDEIRPAFFWPNTGAIYIDPYYLWTTQAQYNTISVDPDYRSDFGADLSFVALARYTKDGAYAFATGNTRSETQTLYALSAVLFHELAHARDTFPVVGILAANGTDTPKTLADALINDRVSLGLQQTLPLQSETLFDLADVMYSGKNATPDLIALTASDVGTEFETEGANDDYAYVTMDGDRTMLFEDTAMLFEETMMKLHYDIDREMVFATPLNTNQSSCSDFSFDWTEINRYTGSLVIPRATYVVNGLLPGNSHAAFLASPPADGVFTWCLPSARSSSQADPENIPHDHWH